MPEQTEGRQIVHRASRRPLVRTLAWLGRRRYETLLRSDGARVSRNDTT
jgi:hypothetical protein